MRLAFPSAGDYHVRHQEHRQQGECYTIPLPTAELTNDELQAKNIVLNLSEIESKVREATNDDPW
jgi:hypothetical protein